MKLAGAPQLDTSFMEAASCRGKTDVFFPQHGGLPSTEATTVCAGCPVKRPCGQYADATGAVGFWAGRMRRGPA